MKKLRDDKSYVLSRIQGRATKESRNGPKKWPFPYRSTHALMRLSKKRASEKRSGTRARDVLGVVAVGWRYSASSTASSRRQARVRRSGQGVREGCYAR